MIADAWPAEELHMASRIALPGTPLVEYLRDDRLTVISDTSTWIADQEDGDDQGDGDLGGGLLLAARCLMVYAAASISFHLAVGGCRVLT